MERPPDPVVVTLHGELDMASADAVTESLVSAGSSGVAVVADLAKVTFIDSSALGALVTSARTLQEAGSSLTIGPRSEVVARVLEITGLAQGTDDLKVLPDADAPAHDG